MSSLVIPLFCVCDDDAGAMQQMGRSPGAARWLVLAHRSRCARERCMKEEHKRTTAQAAVRRSPHSLEGPLRKRQHGFQITTTGLKHPWTFIWNFSIRW